MEWREEGVLLALRKHGESAAIIEVLTAEHGRHAGLVRGGAGRRMAAALQPGNQLSLRWRARLADHLGVFEAELIRSRAPAVFADREALAILDALRALACAFLPEREPAPAMYAGAQMVLDVLESPAARRAAYAQWEMLLLSELGFSLDLRRCALGGDATDLAYVSPRSGRAVGREAGAPWAEKLLPCPQFLREGAMSTDADGFADALSLTGYFLERWAAPALGVRAPARAHLAALAQSNAANSSPAPKDA